MGSKGKKLTTAEFIERAIKTHGDIYDYSESDYKSSQDTVKIFCKVHGEFFHQKAAEHVRGHGCHKCGAGRGGKSLSKTHEQFVTDCIGVHGDYYDYTKAEYRGSSYAVKIKCNKHDFYFTQKASSHLSGRGCPICGSEKTSASKVSNQEKFLESSTLVHGTYYSYNKTVYIRANKKVIITCMTHGDYEQTPNRHLSGQGCPTCAKKGYNPSKPGHLYLLQCGDITKVGITNKNPNVRAYNVSKSFGAEFSVKHSWEFTSGSVPDEIETVLLRELRSNYNNPVNRFDGYTECFLNVDHNALLSRISQEIELRIQ